jgi:nucleoside-diphosphate-sugar epimerase
MVPAAQSTTDLLQVFSAGSLMTVPSIINDILALPKDEHQRALRFLKGLRFVAVGGGALEAVSAATLSDLGVKLLNHYGVTEIGAIAPIFCPGLDYDWHFLRLRTDLGLKLQPIIENGTAKTSERFKLVGIPIGSEEPFEIQDEMERNPHSSRDEVRILGRRDDLIVLKTGEKVLGRLLEDNLTSDPEIQSAVCVGHGYLEILVLIEASPTARLKGADILDHAWEIVQRVNPQLDQHARVSSKSAIFLKPSGRDIPRSDKGSVMRREVHELFRHEIEAAYTSLEVEQSASVFLHRGNIKQSIRSMVERIVGDRLNCSRLGDNDDFYELGMDSLQSIRLARLIGSSVRMSVAAAHNGQPTPSDFPGLSADYIYRHPSIKALAAAVKTLILGGQVSTAQERDRAKEIRSLLGDLTTSASLRVQRPHHNQATHIVLLTGSTGNLGAHVLNAIVRDRSVREVICLMRPLPQTVELSTINASRSRQEQALSIAGLKLKPVAWDKVRFLESGQGSNYLGSDPYALADLTQSVTHIIHMAWPMDFNRKVESFRPHLEAVKSLTNLARAAHQRRPHVKVRLLFTSSIAVARHYGELMGRRTVPEASIADPLVTMELGYAEAKWICEQMLAKAGTEDSEALEAITVRVGQLSGPERRGVWKTEEHIPALLKTSQAISAFPRLDGVRMNSLKPNLISFGRYTDSSRRQCHGSRSTGRQDRWQRLPWPVSRSLLARQSSILKTRFANLWPTSPSSPSPNWASKAT